MRWYAYAGCLALVPFVAAGLRLPWYGTAVVLGSAMAAWALLLTLIRPTAAAVPLAAVWAAAVLLTVYGTGALLLHGAVSTGAVAAGGYGWALLVAALSHQRRRTAAARTTATSQMPARLPGSARTTETPAMSTQVVRRTQP